MNQPIRHHYLPQSYQDGFCSNDGFLWVYDRSNNTYRRQTPKNTAVIGHYYSVTDANGQKNTDIETKLLQFIDGSGIGAINAARKDPNISAEDRSKLAVYCAFLKFRIPEFEKSLNHLNEGMLKWMTKMTFCNEGQTKAILSEYQDDSGDGEDFDAKEFVEFVQRGNYRIQTSRSESLKSMIELSQRIAKLLYYMDWCFYRPANGKSFVTCDNPFVLLPPLEWKSGYYGYGICSPGTRKLIPLASDLALIMQDPGGGTFIRNATREETRSINLTITDNCHEYVMARDEAHLKSLVQTTGIAHRQWKPSMGT